jgi:hypothetical protein
VIHFERADDGLHAYFRLTLPLVVAGGLGPRRADGNHEPAPFTVLRIEAITVSTIPTSSVSVPNRSPWAG